MLLLLLSMLHTWTIILHDGPNHPGLRPCSMEDAKFLHSWVPSVVGITVGKLHCPPGNYGPPSNPMALITSDCGQLGGQEAGGGLHMLGARRATDRQRRPLRHLLAGRRPDDAVLGRAASRAGHARGGRHPLLHAVSPSHRRMVNNQGRGVKYGLPNTDCIPVRWRDSPRACWLAIRAAAWLEAPEAQDDHHHTNSAVGARVPMSLTCDAPDSSYCPPA